MQRLWIYIRRYRLRYAVGIFATLATVGFANVLPYLYKLSINSIERGQFARLPRYTLLICGIAILAGAARWFSRFVTFNVARDIEYDMRNDLFAHLTTLGPNFYERMKTGDLMSRLINDLTLLRMLFGMVVLSFTDAPVRYVVALTIMMSLNTKLALASVLPYMLLLV